MTKAMVKNQALCRLGPFTINRAPADGYELRENGVLVEAHADPEWLFGHMAGRYLFEYTRGQMRIRDAKDIARSMVQLRRRLGELDHEVAQGVRERVGEWLFGEWIGDPLKLISERRSA